MGPPGPWPLTPAPSPRRSSKTLTPPPVPPTNLTHHRSSTAAPSGSPSPFQKTSPIIPHPWLHHPAAPQKNLHPSPVLHHGVPRTHSPRRSPKTLTRYRSPQQTSPTTRHPKKPHPSQVLNRGLPGGSTSPPKKTSPIIPHPWLHHPAVFQKTFPLHPSPSWAPGPPTPAIPETLTHHPSPQKTSPVTGPQPGGSPFPKKPPPSSPQPLGSITRRSPKIPSPHHRPRPLHPTNKPSPHPGSARGPPNKKRVSLSEIPLR